VWLVCLLGFTYMFDNKDLYEMEVNLFIALIIDIFAVAIIKGESSSVSVQLPRETHAMTIHF